MKERTNLALTTFIFMRLLHSFKVKRVNQSPVSILSIFGACNFSFFYAAFLVTSAERLRS